MSILSQLSSQVQDKTEASNRSVAEMCLKDPKLLHEVKQGFTAKDRKLQADSAEVFTFVAESNPEAVAPFASDIVELLQSKETKTRWEAAHTLAIIAQHIPETVESILPDLEQLIERDKSTIVIDYATETIANYAACSPQTAQKAFPALKKVLDIWGEKHAKQVLNGFDAILATNPKLSDEIFRITESYQLAQKKVVAKLATQLLKKWQKNSK
ncbi:MAG: hypothetical protein Q4F57_07060 [Weeksellaceae bacterium]|nr:hypothetical protein [Weeksellaceae bacterium]